MLLPFTFHFAYYYYYTTPSPTLSDEQPLKTSHLNRDIPGLKGVTTAHLIEQSEAHSGGVLVIRNHYPAETVVPDVHVTQVFYKKKKKRQVRNIIFFLRQ